jgi:hypothetical protein
VGVACDGLLALFLGLLLPSGKKLTLGLNEVVSFCACAPLPVFCLF